MNVVQEIHRINARELESGSSASWHDQYKDSAYIYVGGLPHQLTEGDVITIFSQYGEVVDVSLPRDPATQKPKGFAFLMYADQRSTVLAVDNLGGAKVLERTLRVDHVLNYKQLERDKETGKMVERDAQSLAAHPDKFRAPAAAESSDSDSDDSHASIDLDDPMRDYLIRERKEAKKAGGKKDKGKKRAREGESKEERRERREKKRRAKEEKAKGKERKRVEGGEKREKEERSKGREREERPREREDRREEHPRDDRRKDDERRGGEQERGRGSDRDEDRKPARGGGSSAFADLEKWATGGR